METWQWVLVGITVSVLVAWLIGQLFPVISEDEEEPHTKTTNIKKLRPLWILMAIVIVFGLFFFTCYKCTEILGDIPFKFW